MQTSGERTKANFMTNLVAEDVIGSRKSSTGLLTQIFQII